MDLSKYPKRTYTKGYTPLEHLDRFSEALGGPQIYIKRDDLTGLIGGGNKARKLEFALAEALEEGADTLITCGAVQSNSCRASLAAANREGLRTRLLLLPHGERGQYNPRAGGNNLLYHLLGVDRIEVAEEGIDSLAEMERMAEEARAEGLKPYILKGNDASARATIGHVICAQEIVAQLMEMNIEIDMAYTVSGSGGTHAGLLIGTRALGRPLKVTGICIRRSQEEQEARAWDVVQRTSDLLGITDQVPRKEVVCDDGYYLPGYLMPNPGMVEAVKLLAKTEGILLDPIYSGKAMAGLIDHIRQDRFSKDRNILFMHTGGVPALDLYADVFLED